MLAISTCGKPNGSWIEPYLWRVPFRAKCLGVSDSLHKSEVEGDFLDVRADVLYARGFKPFLPE